MRKAERKKVEPFEMWCWRRVMRVSWMERKTNVRVKTSGQNGHWVAQAAEWKRRLSP